MVAEAILEVSRWRILVDVDEKSNGALADHFGHLGCHLNFFDVQSALRALMSRKNRRASSVAMVADGGKCWQMLASAGKCWQVLVNAGKCWEARRNGGGRALLRRLQNLSNLSINLTRPAPLQGRRI